MTKQLSFLQAAAAIVHDVKNSLGLINAEIHEVSQDIEHLDEHSANRLYRVRQENDRINNVILHLLALYRSQNDELQLSLQEMVVRDILEDVVSRHEAAAARFGISLHIHCAHDLLAFVDANLVDGMLANVLTNAIRYTKDRIWLEARAESGGALIEIRDNGQGYPDLLLDCLEVHSQLDFKAGSTGIGLVLAQHFAQLHQKGEQQGWIKLFNDQGAVFQLWIP